MRYQTIRESLRTGDIVLFSGDSFVSRLIRLGTPGPWSHVGMVIVLPGIERVMLWESTTLSKIKDLKTGKLMSGVQLVWLSEKIRDYNGRVAIRKLETPIQIQPKRFGEVAKELHGRPYEDDWCDLIKAAWDGPWGDNVPDLDSVFCSELTAATLKRLNVMEDVQPDSEYTPADFAGEPLGLIGELREAVDIET